MATLDVYLVEGTYSESGLGDKAEPGDLVELDGPDGFYDQYFEGKKLGDRIRFLVFPSFRKPPRSAEEWWAMRVITAVIERHEYVDATARIQEIVSLEKWVRTSDPLYRKLEAVSRDIRPSQALVEHLIGELRESPENAVCSWLMESEREQLEGRFGLLDGMVLTSEEGFSFAKLLLVSVRGHRAVLVGCQS